MANLVRFEPIREMVRMSDAMDRLLKLLRTWLERQ
jgi:hypothetical protein